MSLNLVKTTPLERLDGLSWNLQGIFLRVSSCAPDKNFWCLSVSKSVSHINQKKKIVTKSCQDNSSWATGWIDLKFCEYVPWIPYCALLLRFYVTALKWLYQLNSVLLTTIFQKPLNGLIWNFVRMFPRTPSFALYTCLMRNFF